MARASHPRLTMRSRAFKQRADLLRSVAPKNSNRPSEDGIHHTETAVGQRSNFRERGEIFRTAAREDLREARRLREARAIPGDEHVLRRDRPRGSYGAIGWPRASSQMSYESSRSSATGRRSDDADRRVRRETSWRASRSRSRAGLRAAPAIGARSSITRLRGAPRLERIQDLLGPRALVARDLEPLKGEERPAEEPRRRPRRRREEKRGEETARPTGAASCGRRALPAAQEQGLAIHRPWRSGIPRPGVRRPPPPCVRRRSPARRSLLEIRRRPVSFQTDRRRSSWPACRAASAIELARDARQWAFSREG